MALTPTSSERLGRFPPIWGEGGASAKNGRDLAERGRGGGVLEMKLGKKRILG